MARLIAEGSDSDQRWDRELPEGQVVRLGRLPEDGWDVSWDEFISREHADLQYRDGVLAVRRLPKARNPVHFEGKSQDEFTLQPDQEFRIGNTLFRFVTASEATVLWDEDRPPDQLGRYRIGRLLGSGGMGSVYLARNEDSGAMVALKLLDRTQGTNPDMVRRFRSEARSAAKLKHENIVRVYDADSVDGYSYIAQEYVQGTDMERLIEKRGPLSARRSVKIIRQIASALEHAHQLDIVHRDIKPSNLLVRRDGVVKLGDMGLARSMSEAGESQITAVGAMVGTIDYISPEQADDSKSADARSDIYSLGCTWYQMLTGSPPFPEGSLAERLNAHAIQPPPDPRNISPDVPEGIVAVLTRMMAKSPDRRYQTAGELLEDLDISTLTQDTVTNDVLASLSDSAGSFQLGGSSETSPATPQIETIAIECPDCGQDYQVAAEMAGKRLRCRECGTVVAVPG